ncbi:DNA polymerase IV [Polystyrenella longa]|uniref:DNA polymerase IV n=1 Tax=Polystyrenella longa TaxID=2528007 RepID=A0A518CU90_9PLAN|nr:DNA polymerase IV [Polystyrenella longa]QDU82799.1 DNA polymerase IV [Polystyrenella longa]
MYTKLIGHVDSDCFYVSAERVRRSHLQNVPCGVLGNQGACVIAKSYELKADGVKTGMPIWEAVKYSAHAVFVKRDFRWYEVVSKRMLDLLKTVSPSVEYYSIDEMFFDANQLPRIYNCSMEKAAYCLQEQIREKVGIPVSIGIAPSKTLAKLGSDTAKPYGCRVLLNSDDDFLKSQPVGELCGVGGKSNLKLQAQGIHTCYDFIQADRIKIRNLLTVKGEALWYELHGESVCPIVTRRPTHKAISRGGSIGHKSKDWNKITGWLTRNIERLSEALNAAQLHTHLLTLSIQFEDHTGWGQTVKLEEPTSDSGDLLGAAKQMMSCMPLDQCVSYMHLIADRLTPHGLVQKSLFKQRAPSAIDQLKEAVNTKLGRFVIRSGDTLEVNDLYGDEANNYEICDVSGKMCF